MRMDDIYKILYNIVIIYIIISFIEWFFHKYLMHGDPTSLRKIPIIGKTLSQIAIQHNAHHKQILMDMHYIKDDITDGFHWFETFLVCIIFTIFVKLFTTINDNKIILFITVSMTICYCFLWNTIHNKMHYTTKTITIKQGVPSIILDETIMKNPLYRYLYINHGIHHLQKGEKYNYNIILPLFDHIFFTKKTGQCFNNESYCKNNKHDNRCKSKVIGCMDL